MPGTIQLGIMAHALPVHNVVLLQHFALQGRLAIQQGYYHKHTNSNDVRQYFLHVDFHTKRVVESAPHRCAVWRAGKIMLF
jgi:hypothetical protein